MAPPRILFVEGSDDEHVVKNICGQRGIPNIDEVKAMGGVSEVLAALSIELRTTRVPGDKVGAIVDANANLNGRWQTLRQMFEDAGYANVPTRLERGGLVLEPPSGTMLPRAGVWIMPNNSDNGALEDFLLALVSQPSPLFAHAVASVDAIPPPQPFSPDDRDKALLHTYLAWQSEPGRPYGTAIAAGFLTHSVPQVDALADWLNRLFFAS